MSKLTVAAIQFCPKVGDVSGNLKIIERNIKKAVGKGVELIVLPEICDIGYNLKAIKKLAKAFPNDSTEFFSRLAKKNKVIIVAGLAERRGKRIYNTAVMFDKNGRMRTKYDKTHLCPFPKINEPTVFSPGSRIFVASINGIKIGITICYEIRFPEIFRKFAIQGAQLIVHPTAFPKVRVEQLEVCMRTRAIENQFFLVCSNQCGRVGGAEFGGSSMIVGPDGAVMAKAPVSREAIAIRTIDLKDIQISRKKMPVFSKRRPELY